MSALTLSAISKSYGDSAILKNISLDVQPGEFIALVGPSGCGKSTLLRILAGLDHADSGEIVIGGREMSGVAAADRNIAMVFQSYALYPHLSAGQNIAVPLAMRRLSRVQRLPFLGAVMPGYRAIRMSISRDVQETAKALKIDHLLERKPGQMSGGQRQRVALARAMVRHPSVFLMDEPLSNLDANLRVHARGEIVELHRRAGVPTVYVTHDQAEALSMADRVAVMIGGQLLQLAAPQVIYDDPAHIEVAHFVGQPRINLLTARADGGTIAFGDIRLALEESDLTGADVTIGIRPEFVRLAADGQTALPARIERMEFLGSEVILFCRLNAIGETVLAKLAPAEAAGLAAGMAVALSFQPDKAMVFAPDGRRLRAAALPADVAREKAHG
jgi:multiple sugar transport system ATP-binding protein